MTNFSSHEIESQQNLIKMLLSEKKKEKWLLKQLKMISNICHFNKGKKLEEENIFL